MVAPLSKGEGLRAVSLFSLGAVKHEGGPRGFWRRLGTSKPGQRRRDTAQQMPRLTFSGGTDAHSARAVRGGNPLPPSQAAPKALCALKAAEGSWSRAQFAGGQGQECGRVNGAALSSFSLFPFKFCSSFKIQFKFYLLREAFLVCPDENLPISSS